MGILLDDDRDHSEIYDTERLRLRNPVAGEFTYIILEVERRIRLAPPAYQPVPLANYTQRP